MGRKVLFVFFVSLVFVFLCFASVVADEEVRDYRCDDDQRIMKLSGDGTNSLMAFWNYSGEGYDTEICYDEIFGEEFNISAYDEIYGDRFGFFGDDPRTNSVWVIALFEWTNPQKSFDLDVWPDYRCDVIPSLKVVSFGDMVCNRGLYDCPTTGGWEFVVASSDVCGGNLSIDKDDNENFPIEICCTRVNISDNYLYWADANGNNITTNKPNVGDTIQAIVLNKNLGAFNIWEEDDLSDDHIKTNAVGFNVGGNRVYYWTITSEDLDLTLGDYDDFYFNNSVTGSSESIRIAINDTYDDSLMNITIVSPNSREDIKDGINVTINIIAEDADDFIYGNVSINGEVVESFTNGGVVFNYTFDLLSDIEIIAKAVNSRGEIGEDVVNIIILDEASELPVLYWADVNGNNITQEDEVNVGDTIQAIVTGVDSGTFDILDEDLGDPDYIRTGVTGESIGDNLVYKWTITEDDLKKADSGWILGDNFENFYFTTSVTGDDKSEYINISGDYDDSPMNITIVRPECGEDFDIGEEVTIEVAAEDEDDEIYGNVSINGEVVRPFTNGGVTFNYTFGISGNVKVVAEAINNRSKRSRHIANIMIINGDGKYIAACISEPKDFSDMPVSSVHFDASNTKAILVSGEDILSFTPINNPTNFSWYWTFSVAEAYEVQDRFYNFIKNDSSKAYNFTFNFPSVGNNLASLRVDFE